MIITTRAARQGEISENHVIAKVTLVSTALAFASLMIMLWAF